MPLQKGSVSTSTPIPSYLIYGQSIWFILILFLWVGLLFFSPLDSDYTSGELLDHFFNWSESGVLYPSIQQSPYRVLNYPPLYLGLVELISRWGLTPLLAGRLLNILAFAAALLGGLSMVTMGRVSPTGGSGHDCRPGG